MSPLARLRIPLPPLCSAVSIAVAVLLVGGAGLAAEAQSVLEERVRLASGFEVYDFEPRGNRPDSRDRDHDGIPDYWQKLRGAPFPDYETMELAADPERRGFFPGRPGRVLYLTYSGREVGAETVIPKTIDPQLAYEVTAYARTRGLRHSVVSVDLVWLRVDEQAPGRQQVVETTDRIVVPPGQVDWTEAPLRRRINQVPARANALRLVCRIRDDPAHPGADRHGEAWFDDIRVLARPKIEIGGAFTETGDPLRLYLTYRGLKRKPDPDQPGRYVREDYRSRVVVRDVDGRLVYPAASRPPQALHPGASDSVTQEIDLAALGQAGGAPRGVYYVRVTLYGDEPAPLATVRRAVGRWPSPRARPQARDVPGLVDQFGVRLDPYAAQRRATDQVLADAVARLGVFRAKVELWPQTPQDAEADKHMQRARDLVRALHARGVRFTGQLGRLRTDLVPGEGMYPAMRARGQGVLEAVDAAAREFEGRMDDWQWGAGTDLTFSEGVRASVLAPLRKGLREKASAFVQALPLVLGQAQEVPSHEAAEAINIRVPADTNPQEMVRELWGLAPSYFAQIVDWEREVYPTEALAKLGQEAARRLESRTTTERVRRTAQGDVRRAFWLDLEPLSIDPDVRRYALERRQAIDLARKAVLGLALGFERIYLGSLTDGERGLAEATREGKLLPRPAFLAARVLAEHLSGSEYLGSLQLGAGVRNFVFGPRTRPRETVTIVLWYEGPERSTRVDLGRGVGRLSRVDLAGNVTPNPDGTVTVDETPMLLAGMPVALARTRMSIAILDQPALRAHAGAQTQRLRIRNFFTEPLVVTARLIYAAHRENGRLRPEPGWSNPPVLRMSLPPGGDTFASRVERRQAYEVRPTPQTTLGRKYVRVETQLAAAGESQFNLLRHTELTSDVEMKVTPIASPLSGQKVLRLALLWRPDPQVAHPRRLHMRPYYQFGGEPRVYLRTMVLYPAAGAEGAALRDIRIPSVRERRRVWIGADEDGGGRFVRSEVTDYVFPPEGTR